MEIVAETRQYHILIILTDGAVDSVDETAQAIVDASNYPLSIVAVGVGDANFDVMHKFDDELPARRYDNFQFVEFNAVFGDAKVENPDVAFAIAALQEIPEQFQEIKRLHLLH